MLDSSTALMLLILLGVVILVILVIAFMFNMKKSEARNDQILGDLNDSISELQNRMNTVEGDRSAVIEVVSPRDTVEEASDTGDWVNYSRSSAEEPPKGRETQPEYAEQSRQLKPENRANRNTDMTGRPERSRREADTETDTDDFWSQFERSDSRSQSKNMERQTMEGYTPAAPAGRNPDVDFGMSAGRYGTEGRSGSGQSPLDRQMESRRGAHAAQSGGLLNSFGFGSRKDDTIVIEHHPEEQWTEETEPRQSARQYEDSQRQSQAPQYGGQTIQQEQQYGQQQYGGSQRQPQPQAPQYGGQAMQQEQQYGQQYGDSQRQPQPQAGSAIRRTGDAAGTAVRTTIRRFTETAAAPDAAIRRTDDAAGAAVRTAAVRRFTETAAAGSAIWGTGCADAGQSEIFFAGRAAAAGDTAHAGNGTAG